MSSFNSVAFYACMSELTEGYFFQPVFIFRGLATTPQALTGMAQRDWYESIWPPRELKHLCILISSYSLRSRPNVFGNVLKTTIFFSFFEKKYAFTRSVFESFSPVHTKTLKR